MAITVIALTMMITPMINLRRNEVPLFEAFGVFSRDCISESILMVVREGIVEV